MSFAQDNGYTPSTFDDLMDAAMEVINTQRGTTFTRETFVGTNWYKFCYVVVQLMIRNEVKTAEIFLKLQEYINTTNLRIQRPSVSLPGVIDSLESRGYVSSVRKPTAETAGEVAVCVEVDDSAEDYAATRLLICNLLKDYYAAGMVFDGTEEETITLSNGQDFDFSYNLPDETPLTLRLTITSSDNLEVVIPSDVEIRQRIYDNIHGSTDGSIAKRYRLGWDFEPQRYYTLADAPWAATILLEWSDNDGETWSSDVIEAEFDDLFVIGEEGITVSIDPPPPEDP